MYKKLIYLASVILVLSIGSLTQAGLVEWEAAISSANPLHWYKFNETGSDCIDSGIAGLNGTYDGVSLAQRGFFGAGTAVGFERSGANRVNFENATDMPGPWTVEYIVKTTKPPAANDSQALHDSDTTSIRLAGWTDLGEAGFTLYGVADYRFGPEAGFTLNDLVIQPDVWMHLAWRNDGNGTQLFFNGILVGTSSDSIDLPRLRIGARGTGPADHLNGVLDEAVVFDRALSDSEIITHANAIDPFLVGWWRLDEGSGETALDATGKGNNGILEDGPTFVDGQFGQALAFEDSRVVIGASGSLTADLFQGSFTLSAWINPKRTGNTWQQIFRSIREDDTSNDTLFINNDGRLSWRGRVGGGWAGGMCETSPDVVPADQWTHVAVTGDRTNFRVYVNGELSQESAFQTTDGLNAIYYIGGDPSWIGESYTGMIDDVRIYTKAMSAAEVLDVMEGGGGYLYASNPYPADGAILADTNVTLSWSSGSCAQLHIVYFGDNFDDVNNDAGGILLETTTYVPGPLELDKVYYWRVDEFDGDVIHKGDVWSFTVADLLSEALDSGPHTLE